MARFEVNPSKDVLTPQMREGMRRILEGRKMEDDMTKQQIEKDILQDDTSLPGRYTQRAEPPPGIMDELPSDQPGNAGTDVGGATIPGDVQRRFRESIDAKFDSGAGGLPAEAMPYDGPEPTRRPVQLRGTRTDTNPLQSWVASNTVNWEARRDKQGNIAVYNIPAGDYGGAQEVAGITDKYHPEAFRKISSLPPEQREPAVAEYVINYTSPTASLVPAPLQAQAVDLAFNRGPSGYTRLVQEGLNRLGMQVKVDGAFGPKTLNALNQADPEMLIDATEDAYLARERVMAESNPDRARLLPGIINRSNKRRVASKLYARGLAPAADRSIEGAMPFIPNQPINEAPSVQDEFAPRQMRLG